MGLPDCVKNADSDDWYVEGSDDEKYDPSKSGKGLWEPSREDILQMFEKLEKEKVLTLNWKCPGRRPPKKEGAEDEEGTQDPNIGVPQENVEEEEKPQQPTEFDFDDDEGPTTTTVTPRRTPGSKTPKTQKKVATMDKVLADIMIQRKQSAADKEARRMAYGRSPRTPTGRPRPQGTSPSAGSRHGLSPGTSPIQNRSPVPQATSTPPSAVPGYTRPASNTTSAHSIDNPTAQQENPAVTAGAAAGSNIAKSVTNIMSDSETNSKPVPSSIEKQSGTAEAP